MAHIIVDGPIDGECVRNNLPELVKERPDQGLLQPDGIAENYLMLHRQPRNAWTFEVDIRPFKENW